MRLIDADDLLERFVYADVKTELVNAAHDIIVPRRRSGAMRDSFKEKP